MPRVRFVTKKPRPSSRALTRAARNALSDFRRHDVRNAECTFRPLVGEVAEPVRFPEAEITKADSDADEVSYKGDGCC